MKNAIIIHGRPPKAEYLDPKNDFFDFKNDSKK